MRVLFVCTGNSCRSPMAELYFNSLRRRYNRFDIEAASAGVHAWDGEPASRQAVGVLEENGIDAAAFRSRRFLPEMADQYDLIVPMTAGHEAAILEIAPQAAGKIRRLLEFTGGGDVPDPYGGGVDEYTRVFNTMRPALEALFQGAGK